MYSVQNSPRKEMLFLHIAPVYVMLTAGLYEDGRIFCSIQYSLLSDISAVYSTLCSLT